MTCGEIPAMSTRDFQWYISEGTRSYMVVAYHDDFGRLNASVRHTYREARAAAQFNTATDRGAGRPVTYVVEAMATTGREAAMPIAW